MDAKARPPNARRAELCRVSANRYWSTHGENLIGKKFGKLQVVSQLPSIDGKRRWQCVCTCGAIHAASGVRLRRGLRSCGRPGCKPGTSHGLSKKSVAYNRWKTMMARCRNPRHENFKRYGGRGVGVCQRWNRFENFLADMGEPAPGHVLDRINNAAGYSPGNCRWATYKESTQNRSNTVWVDGRRINELAAAYAIPAHRLRGRLRFGWTLAEIIQHPGPIRHGFNRNRIALNPNANHRRFLGLTK